MTPVQAVASALADMEEARLCNDCMADACEVHDEMPEPVIGCGDAAELVAALANIGWQVAPIVARVGGSA